ncbi:MAG: peptidase M50 [Zoogloeaceae bacterium]|jgi:putative peptide zinc metalloprotease protein|nr:peptidase M50 [Zoogloeaceae bacterium]
MGSRRLFSSSWHSVAALRPRLVPQARFSRHVYRGRVWHVAQEQGGGRHYRLSPAAYAFVCRMDGHATVQRLWEEANAGGTGDACTQEEVVELLLQLHAADLLQMDATPDSAALFERHRQKRRNTWKQSFLNPMSVKLPLVDPDAFLQQWSPYLAWCFGRAGFLVWFAVVAPAIVLAIQHGKELTHSLSDRVLAPDNLLVLLCVYPVLKLLHELGHGFAVRVWGGAVHEMGLMFLVFMPIPYVNASAASSFSSRWRRMIVAAAGMMTELFIAALALYTWLLVEPGMTRAVAYNILFLAGVSTLVVNGNPLLRYDGYYILCDLIAIPNLAQRGQKYLTYLWDRFVFGAEDADPPREQAAEKRWLVAYTPLAWCYRMFVLVSIILFVAGEFFIFGVLLAVWGTVTLIGAPLWKAWRHVTRSPLLQRRRVRAIRITLLLTAGVAFLAFALPLPLRTQAEGVVWLPEQAILHAGGNGFFVRWRVAPGTWVAPDEILFELEDPFLAAEVEVARARVEEARARFLAEQFADPVKAQVSGRQLREAQTILAELEARAARLQGKAGTQGVLVAGEAQDMPGRYYRKGEALGYVLTREALVARMIVPQDDIDLVRARFRGVQLRLADQIHVSRPASLARAPAGAVDELPSPALGLPGGGVIPTRPDDPKGVRTTERVFLIDLALPPDLPPAAFGERVYARFDHGWEPLAWQGLRRLRQLFLARFGV